MDSYQCDDLSVTLDKEGSKEFNKVSFPIRYGRFSEIRTPDYLFQFNRNGEVKYIQGLHQSWPHPAEWLKRTVGDDWVYYSAGDYKGVHELFGEYYFPCLSYPSNSIIDSLPFDDRAVKSGMLSLQGLRTKIREQISGLIPREIRDFLTRVIENDEEVLKLRSDELHHLIGGAVTVLPPDARHVDYEVIPVIIADGCLYNCGFCRVKSGQNFSLRPLQTIIEQMKGLKKFYANDLHNYNAVFLGQHDALRAGRELLEFSAKNAYEIFDFEHSYLKEARLFLFGSVDSMIQAEEALFDSLNGLPFFTYINIGLESADPPTLATLEKPISVEMVYRAFNKMLDINKRYEKIEITANFVFGRDLPPDHFISLLELTGKRLDSLFRKGAIYLSPLIDEEMRDRESKRELLRKFKKIKAQSLLPMFIYLIQRL